MMIASGGGGDGNGVNPDKDEQQQMAGVLYDDERVDHDDSELALRVRLNAPDPAALDDAMTRTIANRDASVSSDEEEILDGRPEQGNAVPRWDLGPDICEVDVDECVKKYKLTREQAAANRSQIISSISDVKIQTGYELVLREHPENLFESLSRQPFPRLHRVNALQMNLLKCQVAMLVEQRMLLQYTIDEIEYQRQCTEDRVRQLESHNEQLLNCSSCSQLREKLSRKEDQLVQQKAANDLTIADYKRYYEKVFAERRELEQEVGRLQQLVVDARANHTAKVSKNHVSVVGIKATRTMENDEKMVADEDAILGVEESSAQMAARIRELEAKLLEKEQDATRMNSGKRWHVSDISGGDGQQSLLPPFPGGHIGNEQYGMIGGLSGGIPSQHQPYGSQSPVVSATNESNALATAVATMMSSIVELSLGSLPKYSGQFGSRNDSWDVFVRKFEQRSRGITAEAKIEAIRDMLEGDAKIAFENMTQEEKVDFPTFSAAMNSRLQRSGPMSTTHLRVLFHDIKQNGRQLEAVLAQIETDAAKAFPTFSWDELDQMKKDALYRAVDDEVLSKKLMGSPSTWTFAKLSEEALKRAHIDVTSDQLRRRSSDNTQSQGIGAFGGGQQKGCYFCGDHGHQRRNCPKMSRQQPIRPSFVSRHQMFHNSNQSQSGPFCGRCKQSGHLSVNCSLPYCANCRQSGHRPQRCSQPTICFRCRRSGHMMSNCPMSPNSSTGYGQDNSGRGSYGRVIGAFGSNGQGDMISGRYRRSNGGQTGNIQDSMPSASNVQMSMRPIGNGQMGNVPTGRDTVNTIGDQRSNAMSVQLNSVESQFINAFISRNGSNSSTQRMSDDVRNDSQFSLVGTLTSPSQSQSEPKQAGPVICEDFFIFGTRAKGCWDCGSAVSMISLSFCYRLLKDHRLRPENTETMMPHQLNRITTVTGEPVRVHGAIALPVKYRDREPVKVWFQIQSQGASTDILLGTNCWSDLGMALYDKVDRKILLITPSWIPIGECDQPQMKLPDQRYTNSTPPVETVVPPLGVDLIVHQSTAAGGDSMKREIGTQCTIDKSNSSALPVSIVQQTQSTGDCRNGQLLLQTVDVSEEKQREITAVEEYDVNVVSRKVYQCRAVVEQHTVIPANQAIRVRIRALERRKEKGPAIFKLKAFGRYDISCPPAVVAPTKGGRFEVFIENKSDEQLTLRKGMVVGKVKQAAENEIGASMTDMDGDETVRCGNIQCSSPLSVDERVEQLIELIKLPDQEILGADGFERVKAFIRANHDMFSLSEYELRQTDLITHTVNTGDSQPIKQRQRPVPFGLRKEVSKIIQDYLDRKLISPSNSPWSSPVVLVRKKDGKIRFCVDYRKLNDCTVKDAYPMPDIDSLLLGLGRRHWFSYFDMDSGYQQIKMNPADKAKTAFAVEGGLYEYNVMPFGLTGAVATFQRFMETALKDLLGDNVHLFMDDVMVANMTLDEHLESLAKLFDRFRTAGGSGGGLLLKPSKCGIALNHMTFLGHIVSSEGVSADPDKIQKIAEYPRPKNVNELRIFLGLTGYCRKFVKNFSKLASPLTALLKKKIKFNWTDECERAFVELRERQCYAPVLAFPDFEAAQSGERPFIIETDASATGLGAVLSQKGVDGFSHPIYYASRSCSKAEQRYHVTDQEALAVVFAINKFSTFIMGMPVIVYTDHQPLTALFKTTGVLSNRLLRWSLLLQQYNPTIIYRKGVQNVVADALSRIPGDAPDDEEGMSDIGDELLIGRLTVDENTQVGYDITNEVRMCHRTVIEQKLPDEVKEDWDELVRQEFSDLISYMRDHKVPTTNAEEILALSRVSMLENGRLYFINDADGRLRIVVPTKYRKLLVDEMHSGKFAGHLTDRTIYSSLAKDYYWPQMRADVRRWCRACMACAATRRGRCVVPPMVPIISDRPFQILAVDVLKIGLSSSGNKYIVVFIDHFTKYMCAYATADKSAETIAKLFVEKIVCVHGAPEKLLSDRGGEFLNEIMVAATEVLNIEKVNTAGYSPQTTGIVERPNRTIKGMLAKSTLVPTEWDVRLPFVIFAYNIAKHSSTGESPFFLIYGRDPKFPSKIAPGFEVTKYMTDLDDYKHLMLSGLQEATEQVQETLRVGRERMKKYFDQNHKVVPEKFTKGMRVMVFQPQVVQSALIPKLAWPFFGPFRILDTKETSVLVRSIDKPDGDGEWVPMERCCYCPDELPDEPYTGKGKQRKKFGGKMVAKPIRRRVGAPNHDYGLRSRSQKAVDATD